MYCKDEKEEDEEDSRDDVKKPDTYTFTRHQVDQMKIAFQTLARGISQLASVFEIETSSSK